MIPEYERVIYKKQPTASVICQLRFPPILRIESVLPADFQERVRSVYPVLSERAGGEAALALPPELAKIIPPQIRVGIGMGSDSKIYDFSTDDGAWKASLNRGFVSLVSTNYLRWEDFRERLFQILNAFEEIYQPSFYMRVGLRYQDLIQRSRFGLKDVPWGDLLQAHIAGELAFPDIADRSTVAKREIVIMLDGGERVLFRHGLHKPEDSEEVCYSIDADFSTNARTEVHNARGNLNNFNRLAGRFFRWCIKDKLHEAMEPTPV
jgi:uncharacterized protein (TIGR04255 family)